MNWNGHVTACEFVLWHHFCTTLYFTLNVSRAHICAGCCCCFIDGAVMCSHGCSQTLQQTLVDIRFSTCHDMVMLCYARACDMMWRRDIMWWSDSTSYMHIFVCGSNCCCIIELYGISGPSNNTMTIHDPFAVEPCRAYFLWTNCVIAQSSPTSSSVVRDI